MYIYHSTKTNQNFVNVSRKDIEALRVLSSIGPFDEVVSVGIRNYCDSLLNSLSNNSSINYDYED